MHFKILAVIIGKFNSELRFIVIKNWIWNVIWLNNAELVYKYNFVMQFGAWYQNFPNQTDIELFSIGWICNRNSFKQACFRCESNLKSQTEIPKKREFRNFSFGTQRQRITGKCRNSRSVAIFFLFDCCCFNCDFIQSWSNSWFIVVFFAESTLEQGKK